MKNLSLRPFCMDDAPRIAALANHPQIARWTSNIPFPYTTEDAVAWLQSTEKNSLRTPLAICLHQQIVGCASYWLNAQNTWEIGYWLGRDYWGLGIASEAVRLILAQPALACTGTVVARVMLGNKASEKVLVKNGFHFLRPCEIKKQSRTMKGALYQKTV